MPSRRVAMASALIVFASTALTAGPGLRGLAAPDEMAFRDISNRTGGAGESSGRGTPTGGEAV